MPRPNSRKRRRERYWAQLNDSEDAQAEREFWEEESRAWHAMEADEQSQLDYEAEQDEDDWREMERERLEDQIQDLYR